MKLNKNDVVVYRWWNSYGGLGRAKATVIRKAKNRSWVDLAFSKTNKKRIKDVQNISPDEVL